jgi:D-alanine-D-alanine ligase
MDVLVLHNEVGAQAGPHERDVLDQVAAVERALAELGHRSTRVTCTLDLERVRSTVASRRPDLVFNLVESLGGMDRLIHLVPALLEALGVPFVGSGSRALMVTTDKLWAKELLTASEVAVPATLAAYTVAQGVARGVTSALGARSDAAVDVGAALSPVFSPVVAPVAAIAKSRYEHGSLGLEEDAVLAAGSDLAAALARLAPRLGGDCFAEEYLEGREINVAMLERDGVVAVLPPSEILFEGYGDRPHIVGYRAKWEAESFEYRATPRRLDFPPQDDPLLERLLALARQTWLALGLAGWARIDFRVAAGVPYVLEANANPCLTPEAGFAAALEHAGIPFVEAIESLLASALPRG